MVCLGFSIHRLERGVTQFKAYRLFDNGERPIGRVVTMQLEELSPGDVVIRTAYSSVNYKDALAARGVNKIIRKYPRIGGIDLFGTVVESRDPRFNAGDAVMVHGFGIGVDYDGGHAEYARVSADWVMRLPQGLTLREAAAIGVAGYTAGLSIHLMELNGLNPRAGKVVMNGAAGGVASIAIDMLAGSGYSVTAITGRIDSADYLSQLGAQEVLQRSSLVMGKRSLESALWAGALDSLGGESLGWLTRTMQTDGIIAAFGNAAGQELSTNVLPFILRGVRLIGVNANSPMPLRKDVWARISGPLKPRHLDTIAKEIRLDELPDAFEQLLARRTRGRFVVAMA